MPATLRCFWSYHRASSRCNDESRPLAQGHGDRPLHTVAWSRQAAEAAELLIELDRASREPLRRQLETRLRTAIEGGSLPDGTRLPSSRMLAEQLAVSRGVVVDAYEQLIAQEANVIHKYEPTELGYGKMSHQDLAKVLGTTPHRISALQKWPIPAEDADLLALLIQLGAKETP